METTVSRVEGAERAVRPLGEPETGTLLPVGAGQGLWQQQVWQSVHGKNSYSSLAQLEDVWGALEQGHSVTQEHFLTPDHAYLLLRKCTPHEMQQRKLSARQRDLLRRIILGEQQKSIALECGVSAAAVTLRVRRGTRRIGLDFPPGRLPMFAVVSALAFYGQLPGPIKIRLSEENGTQIYALPRIDAQLPSVLSRAEADVARLLVEGLTHPAIAARRGTALRTVANQVAAIFDKLQVSGRLDLIRVLARRACANDQAQARAVLAMS